MTGLATVGSKTERNLLTEDTENYGCQSLLCLGHSHTFISANTQQYIILVPFFLQNTNKQVLFNN
jgi:hypothetical protein